MERPPFLLYPFKAAWDWYPHLSHALEFSYISFFSIARKQTIYHSIQMPICATQMSTGLIPYSHRFNGTIILILVLPLLCSVYHHIVFMALLRIGGNPQPFRYCGNNQFHTLWTLIINYHNLFLQHFIASRSTVSHRATRTIKGIPINYPERALCRY